MHKVRNLEVMKIFGKNVRKLRLEKGMTQEYLAEEAKISQVQIARMESGNLNTTISNVAALAKALDVNEGKFFEK